MISSPSKERVLTFKRRENMNKYEREGNTKFLPYLIGYALKYIKQKLKHFYESSSNGRKLLFVSHGESIG
jgi:hypothetical protein